MVGVLVSCEESAHWGRRSRREIVSVGGGRGMWIGRGRASEGSHGSQGSFGFLAGPLGPSRHKAGAGRQQAGAAAAALAAPRQGRGEAWPAVASRARRGKTGCATHVACGQWAALVVCAMAFSRQAGEACQFSGGLVCAEAGAIMICGSSASEDGGGYAGRAARQVGSRLQQAAAGHIKAA